MGQCWPGQGSGEKTHGLPSLLRCLDRLESVLSFSALLHHPRGIEGLGLDGERSQGQPRGEVDAKADIHIFLAVGFK